MLRGGALSFCRSNQICERVRVGLENFNSIMKDPMHPLERPLDLMLLEKDSEPPPPDHVKDDCFNPDLDSPITKRMRFEAAEEALQNLCARPRTAALLVEEPSLNTVKPPAAEEHPAPPAYTPPCQTV